jgi:hypothetical protein
MSVSLHDPQGSDTAESGQLFGGVPESVFRHFIRVTVDNDVVRDMRTLSRKVEGPSSATTLGGPAPNRPRYR